MARIDTPRWATPAQVQDITGASVDDDAVVKAEAVIDALTGARGLDDTKLSRRNRRMLMLAACYQTAWMVEQYGIHTRHDVTAISQEGTSSQARDELTFVLAPLAKAALKRTTWGGSRTLRVGPPLNRPIVDPVISDAHVWGRRI